MSNQRASAPVLDIRAVEADRALAETLAGRLRARGLVARLGYPLSPIPSAPSEPTSKTCDVLLMIVSPATTATAEGELTAAYQHAMVVGTPVIPIYVQSALDVPPDLRHVQSLDFSQSVEDGWLALLLVLDQLGMTRYPRPAIPVVDAELVLARLRAGRTPPTWTVTRTFVLGARQLTRGTVIGSALVMILAVLGVLATGTTALDGESAFTYDRLLLLPLAAYLVYILYTRLSPPMRRLDKRGPAVVLTPEGIFIQTKTGYVWASFAQTRLESTPSASPNGSDLLDMITLTVHASSGRATLAMPLTKLLGQGLQAQQAASLYAAFAARYTPERALPLASTAHGAPAPLIFLSYSRKDSALVDRLELALRQAGYNPWVDRSELVGGQAWTAEINQALALCAAVVVVVSPDALRSVEVRREYTHALNAGKPVLGLRARSTRGLPVELRTLVVGDARATLLYGILALTRRLDDLGVSPTVLDMPPGGHLTREPTLTVARALRGAAPSDGRVYRGRLPFRIYTTILVALVCAAILLGLYAISGEILALWLLAVELAALGSSVVAYGIRRGRYPDLIITLPDGFITFFGSGTILVHPYGTMSSITSGRGRLRRGTPLNYLMVNGHPYTIWLPATFPRRRRIVQQMIDDYTRYRETHAPVAVALPTSGATASEPWQQME